MDIYETYLGGQLMKKFISLFLSLTFILSVMVIPAYAESDKVMKVKSSEGREVNFIIKADIKNQIKNEMLKELADENPDTSNITIFAFGSAETPAIDPRNSTAKSDSIKEVSPSLIGETWWTPAIKTYTAYSVLESDRFMASCARGETKTVTSTLTAGLSPGYSGTALGGVSLNGSISYSITVGTTLTGPPEGSSYNSREYRCKFYENRGTWAQVYCILGFITNPSGTFQEPSYYLSYSVDRTV